MAQHYSNPTRESDPHALPDLEIYEMCYAYCPDCGSLVADPEVRLGDTARCTDCQDEPKVVLRHCGWFYWYCFPGCMPDSEPIGPFDTEADALADARENADDDEGTETDRCDSCAALMINGVYCHETGCPNTPRHCEECGSPCDPGQRFCSDECAGYDPALDSFDEDE